VKNLTWQNPEQLFVAQVLIKKVKLKCCGIKEVIKIFPERKKEIMSFQKKNKLKNDNEGIIQVIQYISSL